MKKFLPLFLCTMIFASCSEISEQIDTFSDDNSQITFSSSINASTRVVNDAFEDGDQIYVSAFDGTATYATDILYSYDGSSSLFVSSSPIAYQSDDQQLAFTAVYPAVINLASNPTFSVSADQSISENYESSDLLISSCAATNDKCPELRFSHVLSSLVINISDEATAGGTLKIFAKSTASIDVENQLYQPSGEAIELTPAANGNLSYKVIFAPQTFAAGDIIATYQLGDATYEWRASSELSFLSGYRYTYDWDVTKNDVSLDGYIDGWEDVTITDQESITITISDLSYTSYPDEDYWIITDETIATDSNALYNALQAIYYEDSSRMIYISFPNLEELPSYIFYNCNNLASVSMPKVKSIGDYAFFCCFYIQTIYAPQASTLGYTAINSCDALTSLTLNEDYFAIEDGVVYDVDKTTAICIMPKHTEGDIVLPSTVTTISPQAFEDGLMTTISAPNVTTIGKWAFAYLSNIAKIELATADGVMLDDVDSTAFSILYFTSTTDVDLVLGEANSCYVNGNYFNNNGTFTEFKSITTPAGELFPEVKIELLGDATVCIELGSSYTEPGYIATEDGVDISDSVSVTSLPDTNSVGVWTIHYEAVGSSGCYAIASRQAIVYDPNATSVPSGTYTLQSGSYRDYYGSTVSYSGYTVEVTELATGILSISDFFGGYYEQGTGYGSNYAMAGTAYVDSEGALTLGSSYLTGWGDSLDYLANASYDSTTGLLTWDASYVNGMMIFHVILKLE